MALITLCAESIKQFFKPYYNDVDEGHNMKHVVNVMETALEINNVLNLTNRTDLIMIATIAHDMFSYTHRDKHHEKAYEFIMDIKYGMFKDISDDDRYIIARAVLEHRGSYKGEFYSSISELISAADRGAPNLNKIIKRIHVCSLDTTLVFNTDDMQLTSESPEEDFLLRTYTHLLAKYSRNGYARYNDVYKKYYNTALEEMWIKIDTITLKDIKQIVSN